MNSILAWLFHKTFNEVKESPSELMSIQSELSFLLYHFCCILWVLNSLEIWTSKIGAEKRAGRRKCRYVAGGEITVFRVAQTSSHIHKKTLIPISMSQNYFFRNKKRLETAYSCIRVISMLLQGNENYDRKYITPLCWIHCKCWFFRINFNWLLSMNWQKIGILRACFNLWDEASRM